jgi:transcriptional regulator GlxA family with amidase domain
MTHVAFLLGSGVHLLDLAGPAQVFSTAADHGLGYRLSYVAERPEVPTAQGLPVRASVSWPELTPDDLVVVPGWRVHGGTAPGSLGEPSLRRVREHHANGGTVASGLHRGRRRPRGRFRGSTDAAPPAFQKGKLRQVE